VLKSYFSEDFAADDFRKWKVWMKTEEVSVITDDEQHGFMKQISSNVFHVKSEI